ncbi:MAG: 50S ribosomal protein L18 [Candidatus Micrarchaeia archaeon]
MTRAKGPLYNVHYKRRRLGKTDYAKRLGLLKSGLPRLVVRKTNRGFIIQVTEYSETGDKALTQVTSRALYDYGWMPKRNAPTAYLTGYLCGIKAKAKGVERVVLDIGLHPSTKGGIVFACLKGAVDAGLASNYGAEQLPSEERMTGKHLKLDEAFAKAKESIGKGVKS